MRWVRLRKPKRANPAHAMRRRRATLQTAASSWARASIASTRRPIRRRSGWARRSGRTATPWWRPCRRRASRTTRWNGGTSPSSRSPIPTPISIFRSRSGPKRACLFVAIDALAPLMAFLRFDAQSGDRPGIEALQADRLAGFLTVTIGTVVQPGDGRVDLGDQLALAIAGPQFERTLGFRGGAVGDVGVLRRIVVKMLKRLLGRTENFIPPNEQLPAEIGALALAHERFVFRWAVVFGNSFLGPHESHFLTHPFRH